MSSCSPHISRLRELPGVSFHLKRRFSCFSHPVHVFQFFRDMLFLSLSLFSSASLPISLFFVLFSRTSLLSSHNRSSPELDFPRFACFLLQSLTFYLRECRGSSIRDSRSRQPCSRFFSTARIFATRAKVDFFRELSDPPSLSPSPFRLSMHQSVAHPLSTSFLLTVR